MEEGVAERLRVQDRMIEGAHAHGDDPGWSIRVTTAGLNVTYTWMHDNGNCYMVESFVPWTTLAHAPNNPLLPVTFDLMKQKTEFKP